MLTNVRALSLLLALLSLASCSFANQSLKIPGTTPASSSPTQSTPDNKGARSTDLPDTPDSQVHMGPVPTGPTVVMDTSMGRITCKLFDKQAPQTTANFIGLAQGTKEWSDALTHEKVRGKSLYNGTTFHRVIPDFMVQGGDPLGNGMGDPGYFVKDEFDPNLNFDVAGRLAMANSGPDTNGSQFFITEAPAEHLNQKHTIFGQCDEHSILVVQSMARVEKDNQDKPTEAIILKKVIIVPDGGSVPPPPISTPQTAPAAKPVEK